MKENYGASNELRVTPGDSASSTLTNNFHIMFPLKSNSNFCGVDASFSVDGISMTRPSNTISNLFRDTT